MIELKRCPFAKCGGRSAPIGTADGYFVLCGICGTYGPRGYHKTLEAAAEAWNDRTPEPWLPIETAPKDGEEILLRIEDDTLGKSVLMARWAYGVDAGEDVEGEEGWRDLYANLVIDPLDKHRRRITGWQPLPAVGEAA